MSKIVHTIRSLSVKLWEVIKHNPKKSTFAFVVLSAFIIIFGIQNGDESTLTEDVRIPNVTVMSVAALSSETEPLVLLGEVRSVSQVDLRAQKPGEIKQVYVQAGQYVSAGTIIAELNTTSEQAAVLSAQGMLASAQAQLNKLLSGSRDEDKSSSIAQAQSAQVALQTAKDSARSAYSQAYTLAQDAVLAQADDFFSNAYTVSPSFRVRSASYDEKQVIEAERVRIGSVLETWKEKTSASIPDDMLETRLIEAENDLESIKTFLNAISSYISEQTLSEELTSTAKSAQEATILGARSNVGTAQNVIHGARSALASAVSGSKVASLSQDVVLSGARSEDIASAEASVTQARGALAGAQAALENARVRTPIRGVVSTLNVTRGGFVSAFDVVAVVANESALEIELFVSDTARNRISVGTPALIDGTYKGIVTSISPGLDPVTKKSRITVGVADDATLTNGSFVEVALTDEAETTVAQRNASSTEYSIPISAVKVLPRGFAVFTVKEDNTLQAHEIAEGPIVGSRMLVAEGLTGDMKIVIDVRGLSEGDEVMRVNDEQ